MTTKFYSLDDMLSQRFTPISTLDVNAVNDAIQAQLDFLNKSVSEQISLLAEETPVARRVWGTTAPFVMKEVGEFGEARSKAYGPGVEIDFPLRKFSVSTGWSKEWFQRATAAELAQRVLGASTAYQKKLQDEIKFAIFNNVNYTYEDYLVDSTSLANCRAFLNADSVTIPDAPDGTTFTAASHNHYVGTVGASLAYTDVDTLISNVVEHGNMFGITLFTTPALVSTLAGLTSTKFVQLTYASVIPANDTDATIMRDNADADPSNKLVGFWGNYPVYTRSWVPTGMIACLATGSAEKPLVMRVDANPSLRGLIALTEWGNPVITSKEWIAYFGMGVWNRAAGAVLDTAHQTTYTLPSLIRTV